MNATELIQHMNPAPHVARRVRPIDGSCAPGRVIDVMEDGWVVWVGDDKICHCSRPDYVEPAS